jgi:hypothetical protein
VPLPQPMHRKTQVLVSEYAGALPAGRVIAVAVAAAMSVDRRRGELGLVGDDVLGRWEERVRRHLCTEVAHDLAQAAGAR